MNHSASSLSVQGCGKALQKTKHWQFAKVPTIRFTTLYSLETNDTTFLTITIIKYR